MKETANNSLRLAFALFIPNAIVVGATQSDPTPVKAVIKYSAAPWDDAAYEILLTDAEHCVGLRSIRKD